MIYCSVKLYWQFICSQLDRMTTKFVSRPSMCDHCCYLSCSLPCTPADRKSPRSHLGLHIFHGTKQLFTLIHYLLRPPTRDHLNSHSHTKCPGLPNHPFIHTLRPLQKFDRRIIHTLRAMLPFLLPSTDFLSRRGPATSDTQLRGYSKNSMNTIDYRLTCPKHGYLSRLSTPWTTHSSMVGQNRR